MCGIVAIMGEGGQELHDAFELLLTAGIVRGKDSTGVISVSEDSVMTAKEPFYPLKLMKTSRYNKAVSSKIGKVTCLIGHNRFATVGNVNKRNAHPFKHKNISLVHNGTLETDMVTEKNRTFDTDSEGIAFSMAERDIDRVWKDLDGAAALCWWDETDKSMSIITNGKRPLHFATVNDCKYVIVSSVPDLIKDVVKQEGFELDKATVWEPKPHNMFSFYLEEGGVAFDNRKLDPFVKVWPIKKPYKPHGGSVKAASQQGSQGHSLVGGSVTYSPEARKRLPPPTQHDMPDEVGNREALRMMDMYPGIEDADIVEFAPYYKANISVSDFKSRYPMCHSCHQSMEYEYADCEILDYNKAICGDCNRTRIKSGMSIYAI